MPFHTLRIYFFGLICHVSERDDEMVKDFAYLVKGGGHFPIVAYGPSTSPNDSHSFVRVHPDATNIALNLSGDQAKTDLLFRTYVPSLRNLLGSDLASDAANYAIKFAYPRDSKDDVGRGTLSVASLYPRKGKFFRGGAGSNTRHDGPVARLVELTVKTDRDNFDVNVTAGGATTTIYNDVSTDGCLLIANIEGAAIEILEDRDKQIAVTRDPQDPHTNKFGVILRDAKNVTYTENEPNRDTVAPPACDWIDILIKYLEEQRMTVSVSVECGNTDYP